MCFELASKYPSLFKLCKGVIIELFLYLRFFVWGGGGALAPFNSTFCSVSDGVGDMSSKETVLVSGS